MTNKKNKSAIAQLLKLYRERLGLTESELEDILSRNSLTTSRGVTSP